MVSQEPLWERAGIKATNPNLFFFYIHLLDSGAFAGTEADQFPAVSANQKDGKQQQTQYEVDFIATKDNFKEYYTE